MFLCKLSRAFLLDNWSEEFCIFKDQTAVIHDLPQCNYVYLVGWTLLKVILLTKQPGLCLVFLSDQGGSSCSNGRDHYTRVHNKQESIKLPLYLARKVELLVICCNMIKYNKKSQRHFHSLWSLFIMNSCYNWPCFILLFKRLTHNKFFSLKWPDNSIILWYKNRTTDWSHVTIMVIIIMSWKRVATWNDGK